MDPAEQNPAVQSQEPLRFELTAEQTARLSAWAADIQRGYFKEELLGPADITVSFRMSMFGTEIVARCGASELVLQDL